MQDASLAALLEDFEPHELELELDALECERDLSVFFRGAWPHFDPNPYVHNWHIDAICFPYDTAIETEIGERPIGWIVESGWRGRVRSLNHQSGRLEWRRIVGRSRSPSSTVVALKTVSGKTLTATANHPIFVRGRGYVRADEINVGENLVHLRALRRSIPEMAIGEGAPVLQPGLSLRISARLWAAAFFASVQGLREGISSAALYANLRILQSSVLREIQGNPGKASMSGLRRSEGVELRAMQGLLGQDLTSWDGSTVPGVRSARLSNSGAMAPFGEAARRFLRSGMPREVCPWPQQLDVCGWTAAGGLSGGLSTDAKTSHGARWWSLLSLLGQRRTSRSPYRRRQTEQRDLESGCAVPRMSWETTREPHDEGEKIESAVSHVERDIRLQEPVYNLAVDGNHNYFAGGFLVHNCDHLMAVTDGHIRKLLINVPFRSSKTTLVSVAWPCWIWAQRRKAPISGPQVSFLCLSYASHLSERTTLTARRLVVSDWYQERWGSRVQIAKDKDSLREFDTTAGGQRIAAGFDGATLGFGGAVRIIDDPHKVQEVESDLVRESVLRTYDEALASRVTDFATSAEVIIMQRLDERDLSGHVLERGGFCHLCYDADTEILSERGWVKFRHLAHGTRVMAVDPMSLQGEWQTPSSMVAYDYRGDAIHYKALGVDLKVTPDHRMVFKDKNDWKENKNTNWRVKPAASLPNFFYVPQAIIWRGSEEFVDFGGLRWEPGNFADFMGWYLAEGCASTKPNHVSIRIVQNDGDHADEIQRVVDASPLRATRHRHGRDGLSVWYLTTTEARNPKRPRRYDAEKRRRAAQAFADLGDSHHKYVPEEIKNLAPVFLRRFVVAFAKGDGGKAGRNGRGIEMSSRSRRLIDDLQECCVKAGWATTMKLAASPKGRIFNGYEMPSGPVWKLYIRNQVGNTNRKWYAGIGSSNVNRVPYNGRVYCVSVPATALVVRRNGRVTISGNCLPLEYDATRHCVTVIGNTIWEDPRGLDPKTGLRWEGLEDDGSIRPGSPMAEADGTILDPVRFPPEAMQTLKEQLGPFAAAGQLQQSPAPRGGGLVQREWWQLWRHQQFPPFGTVLVSADTAFTEKEENDATGVSVWGVFPADNGMPLFMLVDAFEERLELPQLVRRLGEVCKKRKADVLLIEGKASGLSTAQEIRRLYGDRAWSTVVSVPKGDKVARLKSVQPMFSGKVERDPRNGKDVWRGGVVYAPDKDWADFAINACASFPRTAHKDVVDSISQALAWFRVNGVAVTKDEYDAEMQAALMYRPEAKPLYDV